VRKTPLFALLFGLLLIWILVWPLVHHSGEIALDLSFGWIAFLVRVVPQLDVRWDGVAVFGVGLSGLAIVGHYLLRWLSRELGKGAEQTRRPWRLRWTLAIAGFVIVMFTAGISMIGATHQTVWLFRSDEPLFGQDVPRPYGITSAVNLKIMGMVVSNHSDGHHTLPTQWREEPDMPRQSWVTQILSYLNYSTEAIDRRREWNDPVNAPSFRAIIPEVCNPQFRAPPLRDQHGFGLNHYAGNSRIFDRQERLPIDSVPDRAANTLMIGEVNSRFVPWGRPENSRDPANGINTADGFGGAPGSHGATFLMMDGSVRFVREDIDPGVLNAMSTPVSER
jgi:hypothetical protein